MRLVGLLMMLMLSGCQAKAEQSETIHGIKVLADRVAIQVTSTGCTNIKSFKLHFNDQQLFVERVKMDHCRRMPHKIWLEFDIANLPKHFQLKNRLSN